MKPRRWITVQQARRQLNDAVSLGTLYHLAHGGAVKATCLGRILLDGDDFDRFLAEQEWAILTPAAAKQKRRRTA